jgi:hypothetical protein
VMIEELRIWRINTLIHFSFFLQLFLAFSFSFS